MIIGNGNAHALVLYVTLLTAVNLGVGWRHQVAFNSKRPCGHHECTDDPEHDRDGVEQQ